MDGSPNGIMYSERQIGMQYLLKHYNHWKIAFAIQSSRHSQAKAHAPAEDTRDLLSLPSRLGGLRVPNPVKIAKDQYHTSKEITAPLVESIIQQTHSASDVTERQLQHKKNLLQIKRGKNIQTADDIEKKLLPPKRKCMQMAREKGVSLWLTVPPLTSLDFTLHKAAFKDALALRYDWPIANTPSHCCYGSQFSVNHAMSCPTGGFPSI
jgi:hypothetical protein